MLSKRLSILSVLLSIRAIHFASALAPPPTFGLASLLFPVRNVEVLTFSELLSEDPSFNPKAEIAKATDFFVDAFWTAKVGGGADQLTASQERDLRKSQLAEFNKRYSKGKLVKTSQFFIVRNDEDEILACAGIELDIIREDGFMSPLILERSAPLMSNLAVSREFRRRGLAEQLVKAVEEYIIETWPEQEACYLLVEGRNQGAVRLYKKLGYMIIWGDDQAETLLPMEDGGLSMVPTSILCMRKSLRGGNNPFARFFRR
mmetsp:Transcript_20898/g.27001  ORF Transcript_20898/g.27001 Transcript_20898/m.27001 type:complete len:260 (+) Transcript_20898:53-832(+)|eukprot:CAMPEP_0198151804 /NCGR_PEP_ID=MMETSP1443-20131203/57154_1 /TAXON_ID=186043 /ORGANISM="Entomoneis sp., Strain CCMP2396" /LENGTH=259 /DNA_ID=CAMNT_0043817609 /DNA_START=37 /DNA_END=816 /DNA_ORIENTATION=-